MYCIFACFAAHSALVQGAATCTVHSAPITALLITHACAGTIRAMLKQLHPDTPLCAPTAPYAYVLQLQAELAEYRKRAHRSPLRFCMRNAFKCRPCSEHAHASTLHAVACSDVQHVVFDGCVIDCDSQHACRGERREDGAARPSASAPHGSKAAVPRGKNSLQGVAGTCGCSNARARRCNGRPAGCLAGGTNLHRRARNV